MVYYDSDQHGDKIRLSPNSVFGAINGALAGTIKYKHSENVVERFARVRFFALALVRDPSDDSSCSIRSI